MNRIFTLGIAVIAGVLLAQPAMAERERGGGRSSARVSAASHGWSPAIAHGGFSGGRSFSVPGSGRSFARSHFSSGRIDTPMPTVTPRSFARPNPNSSVNRSSFARAGINAAPTGSRLHIANTNRLARTNNFVESRHRFAVNRAASWGSRNNITVFNQFRAGSFHRDWDPGRNYYWRGHRWHCYGGVWAVVDLGWPWDWYDYPYPYYYGGIVYYCGIPYDETSVETGVVGPAFSSSTVADVQRDLRSMGYNPGPIDGIMGPMTSRAISAYQEDQGLPVTGTITHSLLRSLGED